MIETARLILTPPTTDDFGDSAAMLSDAQTMQFIGGRGLGREEAWIKLLRNIGHWSAFGYGLFVVRDRISRKFIGELGIAHFNRELGAHFDPFPEAGWILPRDAHGKGYATEALTAVHDWFTAEKGPQPTVCIIAPANQPSLHVAAKLGYAPFGSAHYHGATVTMLKRGG